jgi:hypothetical protein
MDHSDYHHRYDDYYVSVSVRPFEHVHSSLPFLKWCLVLDSLAMPLIAIRTAAPRPATMRRAAE